MTNDLYEAPIKSVYSKVLSMANLSWIVGLLCLSVPYNVCWSLGNGLSLIHISEPTRPY